MTNKYTRLIGILVGLPLLILSAAVLTNITLAQTALTTPDITSPTNGAVVTSAELDKVDWTNATGGTPPYQYMYASFSDAAYTNNLFTSGWLNDSEISTAGTPEGDYYLRVRARDSAVTPVVTDWSNGASDIHKVTVDNTPPVTATISATKIVCPEESMLPNLGAGTTLATVTSNTDDRFLADRTECSRADWTFEYAMDPAPNPGDNDAGATGGAWTAFSDGTADVTAGGRVWLREQVNDDYIPFSTTSSNNVSAEFYCGSDIAGYDNYEFIDLVAGNTYHCIAWNVLKETAPDELNAPTITTPANGATVTSAALVKVDWTNATGGTPPYQYMYESYHNAAYTDLAYQSGWLNNSEIPTPGTPEGDYYLRVRARDSDSPMNMSDWSNGASSIYKITVDNDGTPDPDPEEGNEAPVLEQIQFFTTIPELSLHTFDADATDPDGDTLTFSLVNAPSGATIDSSSGVFNWTPSEAQGPGFYVFQVRVSDGEEQDSQYVFIRVTEVNGDDEDDPARPRSIRDCMRGGWRDFEDPDFRNQGQCIRFVIQGILGNNRR